MQRFLRGAGATRAQCAAVAAKNLDNALRHPAAPFGAARDGGEIRPAQADDGAMAAAEIARPAAGAAVVILSDARAVRGAARRRAVTLRGIGLRAAGSGAEAMPDGREESARDAAAAAYREARIHAPARAVGVAEVDDRYAFLELAQIEALRLAPSRRAGALAARGRFDADGPLPVNPSGGTLGRGDLGAANGLYRLCEAAAQLRGEAGRCQVKRARIAVASSAAGPGGAGRAVVAVLGRGVA